MLKKSLLVLFALSFALVGTVFAQDATAIEYGDTVEGEITNDEFEIPYTFEGAEGDFVVVEMRRADTDSQLYNANLVLLDPKGDTLADGFSYYGYNGADAVVAAELPADGEYTILATRDDGRSGDDEGNFTLRLINLPVLTSEAVSGLLSNDEGDQYFAIVAEGEVTLNYTALDGNYGPLVSINEITEEGYPEPISQLSGTRILSGSLTVAAEEGEFLLVTLTANPIDYFFNDVEAEFELSAE